VAEMKLKKNFFVMELKENEFRIECSGEGFIPTWNHHIRGFKARRRAVGL